VTLADVVLNVVRKLPGPPDQFFCQTVAERAEEAGLPRPWTFEEVYAALDALVLIGHVGVHHLSHGCAFPPGRATAPAPRPDVPAIPIASDEVEVWRGEARLTGIAGITTVAVTKRQANGYIPWVWADDEWLECPLNILTREILAAWALSAEARASHAISRATLLDVQREEAATLAERREAEVGIIREIAGRAHHALHEADVTLFALRDPLGPEDRRAKIESAVRVIGDAHGAFHKAGIAAIMPTPSTTNAEVDGSPAEVR
jgi:hypothetical protein